MIIAFKNIYASRNVTLRVTTSWTDGMAAKTQIRSNK